MGAAGERKEGPGATGGLWLGLVVVGAGFLCGERGEGRRGTFVGYGGSPERVGAMGGGRRAGEQAGVVVFHKVRGVFCRSCRDSDNAVNAEMMEDSAADAEMMERQCR